MDLPHQLSALITRCQTQCDPGCCGINAYDFSPVHIASLLTLYTDPARIQNKVSELRAQIEGLTWHYGTDGHSGQGRTIEEMGLDLTADQIDRLTKELLANLDIAVELVGQSESRRFDTAHQTIPVDDSWMEGSVAPWSFRLLVSTLMLLYTLCRPIIFLWSKVTARRHKPL